MKENENKKPSSMAGAAKGGNTNTEIIGSAVSTAVGEPVATNAVLATWPERIWLQWGPDEREAYPGASEDLTWCADNIHASDVEYVRADLADLAAPTQVSAPTDELKQLRNRVSQLEAARIGYASEFPLTAEGEPDVGNIHANIRALKAQVSAPQANELSISRQKLNMAKIDVLMDGARARSEEFRDGVTFGANSLHMKMLELAGAPQASAAQEVQAVPVGHARQSELDKLVDGRVAGVGMMIHKEPGEGKVALYLAPVSTSTAPAAMDEGRSPWISIDDQLPALHVTVALLDENRWMNTGSSDHNVNWHGAGYLCEFGHKYWSVFGEMRSQCLDAVTHWMPLPSAPASQASLDEVTGAGKGEGDA